MEETLKTLLRNALQDGLKVVEEVLQESRERSSWWRIDKHKSYPLIQLHDNGFPSFYLSDYEKNDYGQILSKDSRGERIESWIRYHGYVTSSDELRKFYQIGEHAKGPTEAFNELWTKLFTYIHLSNFVDRYIHLNNEESNFCEDLFEEQFAKWIKSVTLSQLEIELHIPILLLKFDFEEVKLNDHISVKKIDKQLQLSRHGKTSYIDSSKSTVAAAATHSLVLKGCTIENPDYKTRERTLNTVGSYSTILKVTEDFFSSLRIKRGVVSGFCQIVAKAVSWEDRANGDLDHVNVVSVRKYPDYFDDYEWLAQPTTIEESEIKDILSFFEKISSSKHNNINLALSRLNTSYLRSREEDTILDISIALESLLTHDSKSEITYRLASRIAALCSVKPFKDYSQFEVFSFCKSIYSFRSAIVHGDHKRVKKTQIIKYQENREVSTITVAIELLRHVLEVLIENPKLNKPEELDKLKLNK